MINKVLRGLCRQLFLGGSFRIIWSILTHSLSLTMQHYRCKGKYQGWRKTGFSSTFVRLTLVLGLLGSGDLPSDILDEVALLQQNLYEIWERTCSNHDQDSLRLSLFCAPVGSILIMGGSSHCHSSLVHLLNGLLQCALCRATLEEHLKATISAEFRCMGIMATPLRDIIPLLHELH